MTYLDKDQVLAALNTMGTSYSRKSVMVRATLSDVGAAIAALPAIPLDDRLERIMAFAANVRDVERVGKDFLVDGIMAIIDRDLHLELLDFTPPTDADIAWAKEVSEKLGLGPLPVLETKKETP